MHRFGQIGPTVNRMQRHRTNWLGNYQRSAGPMRAAPGPATWANGRLDQRSSAAMNDAASGRWGWRERVGGKKFRAWGVTSCRRGRALSGGGGLTAIRRARANPPTSAAVVGQGGSGRAALGTGRAAGRRGLILATLATSNGSRDDSLAEPVDLIG